MSLAHVERPRALANSVHIDQEAVLQALNLNPRDPKVQALVLVCQQYGLDPVLKHAVLISGNLYVTRDGLLSVAHRSGNLDGITVEDEGENDKEWWAKVAVHVKGQTHPYIYRGRYPKDGNQKRYGPEMAVKCAEVMALRRAFGVTGISTVEEQWDAHDDAIAAEVVQPPTPEDPAADDDEIASRVAALDAIGDKAQRAATKQTFVQKFGLPQHLRRSQLADVDEWLGQIEAGPASPGGGEGASAPADEEEAAPSGAVSPADVNGPSPEDAPPAPPENDTQHSEEAADDPPAAASSQPGDWDDLNRFQWAVLADIWPGEDQEELDARRTALIDFVSDGATRSSKDLTAEQAAEYRHVLHALKDGTWECELVKARSGQGLGWDVVLTAAAVAEPDTAVHEDEQLPYLRELIAQVPGLGEQRALTRAKRIARDKELPEPATFEAMTGPVLVALIVEVSKKIADLAKEAKEAA